MYWINIPEKTVINEEGFRLFSETIYRSHPTVHKVQLWVKSERDQNGKLTRNNLFVIIYHGGVKKTVVWKNYSPQFYRSCSWVSYDGKIIYIPDYDKGITAVEITTNSIHIRYKLKHVFALWVTSSALLCLHKENGRVISKINLLTNKVDEEIESNGLTIASLGKNCILYKKNAEYYVFAHPDDLHKNIEIDIKEWIGYSDSNFNIWQVSFESGKLNATCTYTDKINTQKIVYEQMMLPCSDLLIKFLDSIKD